MERRAMTDEESKAFVSMRCIKLFLIEPLPTQAHHLILTPLLQPPKM
jgi:hypothetical protein